MTGAAIATLLIKFGPIAFDLIDELVTVWNKDMTPEEVKMFTKAHRKTYEDYIEAEKAKRVVLGS